MFKFQYKLTTLNFLTCTNLHMIEKLFKQCPIDFRSIEPLSHENLREDTVL